MCGIFDMEMEGGEKRGEGREIERKVWSGGVVSTSYQSSCWANYSLYYPRWVNSAFFMCDCEAAIKAPLGEIQKNLDSLLSAACVCEFADRRDHHAVFLLGDWENDVTWERKKKEERDVETERERRGWKHVHTNRKM